MKRKGFIAILILAVIAVVLSIVFINLFKEKDTKKLALSLNKSVSAGYLNDESEEYQIITDYLQDVYTSATSDSDKNAVRNYKSAYKALAVAGEFFNRQIVFTSYTQTYKAQRVKIEENLSKAQKSANAMTKYIKDTQDLFGGVPDLIAGSWANCSKYMNQIYNYTSDAMVRLGYVYQTSATSDLMRNDLSLLVFNTMEELFADTKTNLTEDGGYGDKLSVFINGYMTKTTEKKILNFAYNEHGQTNVKAILDKSTGWEAIFPAFLLGNI